ncbi:hypothetical protein ACO9S2_04925 [Nitrospira sp. NS4]
MAGTISVRRCIAGGGPASMMLGLQLARAGSDCAGAARSQGSPTAGL